MPYANVLKALGDETRLSIMCMLSAETKCVCHIEAALNVSQSSTSKQLMKLKSVGLICSEKKGQWVYYYIPETVYQTYPFIKGLMEEVLKTEPYNKYVKECICYEKSSVCLRS
ncbi:MAG: ArsR/SmtB family transcription factor [Turicibacter sp.]